MCIVDLDPADFWSITERKARKAYRCHSCRSVIKPGQVYQRTFWVDDGYPCVEMACAVCAVISERFGDAHEQGVPPSYLEEALRSCIDWDGREESGEWRTALAIIIKRRSRAARALSETEGGK